MIRDQLLNNIVYGAETGIPDDIKKTLEKRIKVTSDNMERLKELSSYKKANDTKSPLGRGGRAPENTMDTDSYANLVGLINGMKTSNTAEFDGLLDNIFEKNKRYFSVLKDYEVMPILIPQINRILSFLVNECISPDIQTNRTFNIKNNSMNAAVDDEISRIVTEMDLHKLLPKVYMNRFKLGREYYLISDYTRTFEAFKHCLNNSVINENIDATTIDPIQKLEDRFSALRILDETPTLINETSVTTIDEDGNDSDTFTFTLSEIGVTLERSDIFSRINDLKYEYMGAVQNEAYSIDSILSEATGNLRLGFDIKRDKFQSLMDYLSRKDVSSCSVSRLDPARVFKLAPSGKTVGYFYILDNNPDLKSNESYKMAEALRERLMRSRSFSNNKSTGRQEEDAEKRIVAAIAKKIVNGFDPNIGINNIEDLDLLHDFIRQNNLMAGNKKVIFYYSNDIIDLSRTDESILINAVFFTKLYSTLLLNNITTKVLRGRGRQIHTVNVGVSPSMSRYIENAISSLTMPETRLGSITGSFKHLLNPLNAASDIVLPAEDGADSFIKTDLIEGQNVDMDMDILKFLMNSIVLSFGLDSAVIDTTNGNVDFAKTLTMISTQIANSVKNEQADVFDAWSKLVLDVLYIMGSESLRTAIDNNEIVLSFFQPHSLMLNMSVDEMNSAKQFADTVADITPAFQDGSEEAATLRALFVYEIIKEKVNLEWDRYEAILKDTTIIPSLLDKEVLEAMKKQKELAVEESLAAGGGDDDLGVDDDDDEI